MGFKVDIRSVDDFVEDADDPLREEILAAYHHQPIAGTSRKQCCYQFSYGAFPDDGLQRVLGDLAEDEAIGLVVEDLPPVNAVDPFRTEFFSVLWLARDLSSQYSDVASLTLDDAYQGYESGRFDDEHLLAGVLIDFARHPLPGFPVVLFQF